MLFVSNISICCYTKPGYSLKITQFTNSLLFCYRTAESKININSSSCSKFIFVKLFDCLL